jgi:protein-serine/threonine kinase
MPAMVTKPPAVPTSLQVEPVDLPKLLRRDSRPVEFQNPIAEEDENNETASEPAEPVTPTSHNSDNITFAHRSAHDDAADSFLTAAAAVDSKPLSAPAPAPAPTPAPASRNLDPTSALKPVPRTQSNLSNMSDQSLAPPEKPERVGLGQRATSFMRNKLHRTSSHKPDINDQTKSANVSTDKIKTEKPSVRTGADASPQVPTPAVNIPPKNRRLSSFSLSARNSPKGSLANSPPSPASPSSTISHEKSSAESRPKTGRKHSISSTAISSMNKPRPGVSFASNGKDGKRHSWARRRSVSHDKVPQHDDDDKTAGMLSTFSKPAAQGVGMKARRLSVSLPDEFVVDCCDLDKEYKSSSLMPGKRGKVLGKGATAEVRIMARKGAHNEELVAVKEFRGREKSESEEEYIMKIKSEYCIAKSLHHPNIVETMRLCTHHGRWNHVMEYCAHGELYSLVERKLFQPVEGYYSSDDRLCLFKQLLRGVDYLHSHGIAHRDIKLENLLLHKDGHLKISDFGVAEVFSGEHPGLRVAGGECGKNMKEVRLSAAGICGSLPYIAPEVLDKQESYDPRPLDVWSCAIVFLTMSFGGCPWQAAKSEFELYARFKRGWDEWLIEHPDGKIFDGVDGHPKCGRLFSEIKHAPMKRLLLKMLHVNPAMRITIRQVLETVTVKNINCCCPESYEDPKSSVDASKKANAAKAAPMKKYLHHHIPPKPESKMAKVFTHRFDMGEGWQ